MASPRPCSLNVLAGHLRDCHAARVIHRVNDDGVLGWHGQIDEVGVDYGRHLRAEAVTGVAVADAGHNGGAGDLRGDTVRPWQRRCRVVLRLRDQDGRGPGHLRGIQPVLGVGHRERPAHARRRELQEHGTPQGVREHGRAQVLDGGVLVEGASIHLPVQAADGQVRVVRRARAGEGAGQQRCVAVHGLLDPLRVLGPQLRALEVILQVEDDIIPCHVGLAGSCLGAVGGDQTTRRRDRALVGVGDHLIPRNGRVL